MCLLNNYKLKIKYNSNLIHARNKLPRLILSILSGGRFHRSGNAFTKPGSMKLLSGIQPTGPLHIGNYFGCVKEFVSRQNNFAKDSGRNVFIIADLHCYTKPENVLNLRAKVRQCCKSLIALGVDPTKTTIVQQSKVIKFN